jgi:putative membrane protein
MQLLWLNTEVRTYSDVCGACERIKNTPIPYSYSLFLKKFIFIYIITMPYGFIKEFGYGIVLVVSFVFYVLASLELIAEEIENPFGTDANDLELDQISETIEHNIKEIVGDVSL